MEGPLVVVVVVVSPPSLSFLFRSVPRPMPLSSSSSQPRRFSSDSHSPCFSFHPFFFQSTHSAHLRHSFLSFFLSPLPLFIRVASFRLVRSTLRLSLSLCLSVSLSLLVVQPRQPRILYGSGIELNATHCPAQSDRTILREEEVAPPG